MSCKEWAIAFVVSMTLLGVQKCGNYTAMQELKRQYPASGNHAVHHQCDAECRAGIHQRAY